MSLSGCSSLVCLQPCGCAAAAAVRLVRARVSAEAHRLVRRRRASSRKGLSCSPPRHVVRSPIVMRARTLCVLAVDIRSPWKLNQLYARANDLREALLVPSGLDVVSGALAPGSALLV